MDKKCASFNYRMVFKVKTPRKDPNEKTELTLRAWDQDFLKSEFICEWKLDLTNVLKLSKESQKRIQVCEKFKKNIEKESGENSKIETELISDTNDDNLFWLETHLIKGAKESGSRNCCSSKRKNDDKGKPIRVKLDVRVMPISLADQKKAGLGRMEPNVDPYLMPPVGRISFSLNPITMLRQIFGPELLCKACLILTLVICLVLLVYLAPFIANSFFTVGLQKFCEDKDACDFFE